MKKGLVLIACFMFVACAFAQGPLFLSPYKDGHAVPESQKDYTIHPTMNLLVYNKKAADKPAAANVKPGDVITGNENKQPVQNSKAKNP